MKGPLLRLFDLFTGRADMITVVLSFFSFAAIIFLCFPVRAYARAKVASYLGDDTAESAGMLTLNPLAHIDLMGALCMAICNIGWSKYVPISPHRCRKVSARTAAIIIAATGPVSLLLLGLIMVIITKIIALVATPTAVLGYIAIGLYNAAEISVYLAVLNLLPIPSFDGYVLIQGLLPRKAAIWMENYSRIINFVVFVLLISGVLALPLSLISSGIMWLFDLATMWLG